jgi:hypothetical protein
LEGYCDDRGTNEYNFALGYEPAEAVCQARLAAPPGGGAVLGVFPSGRFPISMAFDGSNRWITNQGEGPNTATKLCTSDGAVL